MKNKIPVDVHTSTTPEKIYIPIENAARTRAPWDPPDTVDSVRPVQKKPNRAERRRKK